VKVIVVEISECGSCSECDTLSCGSYCGSIDKEIPDNETIPEWCPLEDK